MNGYGMSGDVPRIQEKFELQFTGAFRRDPLNPQLQPVSRALHTKIDREVLWLVARRMNSDNDLEVLADVALLAVPSGDSNHLNEQVSHLTSYDGLDVLNDVEQADAVGFAVHGYRFAHDEVFQFWHLQAL
jgi:hypothetical protein